MRWSLVLVVLAVGVATNGAEARPSAGVPGLCSVSGGSPFSIARTQNIVADAQAVVRATLLREVSVPVAEGSSARAHVVFAVSEVLRGVDVPDTLRFIGSISDEDAVPPERVEKVPHLEFYRRFSGSCLAMTYASGGEYLLFLQRSGYRCTLDPYWMLLAPTNDQIRGADDRWLRWVRAEIARNPPRS